MFNYKLIYFFLFFAAFLFGVLDFVINQIYCSFLYNFFFIDFSIRYLINLLFISFCEGDLYCFFISFIYIIFEILFFIFAPFQVVYNILIYFFFYIFIIFLMSPYVVFVFYFFWYLFILYTLIRFFFYIKPLSKFKVLVILISCSSTLIDFIYKLIIYFIKF